MDKCSDFKQNWCIVAMNVMITQYKSSVSDVSLLIK